MKRIIFILCAIVLIIGLWSTGWLFIAGKITETITSAATHQTPQTPAVSCVQTAVTGFPFRFDTRCTGAKLIDGDITLNITELRVSVLAYKPTHFLAFAKGPAKISDAFYGTEQEYRWDNLEASVRTNGWQLSRLSVQGENLSLHDTLLADTILAKTNHIEAHLLNIPEKHKADDQLADLALYAKSNTIDLPILGIADGQLSVEAEIINVPDDIRQFAAPNALRTWQQAGGALRFHDLGAKDATANVDMEGELMLNASGEVIGCLEGTSNQVAERFADFFQPQYQSLIFGVRQPDGTYEQIISLVRGTIFAGITPVGTLPPLF